MNDDELAAAIRRILNRSRPNPAPAPALTDYRSIVERMCTVTRGLLDTESEIERVRRHRRRGRLVEEALAALDELLAAGGAFERTPEIAALVDDLATLWRDEPPPPVYELCPIEPMAGLLDLPPIAPADPWPKGRQPPDV